MKKRILSLLLIIVMVLGMLPVSVFASEIEIQGTKIPVTDNVIDITDRQVYKMTSSYYGNTTAIEILEADVVEAYEDGTTIYVVLAATTADDATVKTKFQFTLSKCTASGGEGTFNLSGGTCEAKQTVTVSYYSLKGSVDYNLVFLKEELPTEVPLVKQDTGSAETFAGQPLTIDLEAYFENAFNYYLVDGETETPIEGTEYTATFAEPGTYTLVFRAENNIGKSETTAAVTVTVKPNAAPSLTGEAEAAVALKQYDTWTLDLSKVFADADGDAMTYTVSVNGAAAVAANASYTYVPQTAGEHTFVFQAADTKGAVSPIYTVTLTTAEAPRTSIETGCTQKAGTFDGWLKTITITGPKINAYEWVGGSGHDEASDAAHNLNIQLDPSVANDATIALAWALGGNTNQVKYASTPPASVTLEDGRATVKVTTMYKNMPDWVTTRNYTINFTNKVNTIPEARTETLNVDVAVGTAYEIDLTKYFTDADGDNLTYKVSVNGAVDVAAEASYSYTPTTLGEHVLVFKANDVWSDSKKNLTVTLNVANSTETYDVAVTAPEGYALTFRAVSTVENGAAVTTADLTYADGILKVPTNVSLVTWTAEGAVSGTAAVAPNEPLTIRALTFTAKTAAGEADTAAVIKITDSNGAVLTAGESGVALLATGSGYAYAATPSVSGWNAVTMENQTVTEDDSIVVSFTVKSGKSVTAPKDANVMVYYQNGNYKGERQTPLYTTENADGTVTYYYSCTKRVGNVYAAGYVYRVTMDGKITKAGYLNEVTDAVVSWGEGDHDPSYRGADTTPNYRTTDGAVQRRAGDNVLMTLNSTGHLALSDTKDVGAFRNWAIINTDTENVAIEPDFNFEIVAGDDVVTFTDLGSGYGNNWQKLVKSGSGTAFVEVSFDAIHIVDGYPSGGWGGAYSHMNNYTYNASNPYTTGLIVVQTDGNNASDVTFNIASDRKSFTRQWDAEVDTYYILEDTGSLTLTPTATSGIQSVAVSNDKGANWTTLEASDGAYIATVVPGNNIIRVTNANGQTAYQVVRALKLDLRVENITVPDKGEEFAPGETVRLYITGLISPIGKMGGIYNPQAVQGAFAGSDSKNYAITGPGGVTGSYAFNGNTYYIDNIVIPESGELTLNGKHLAQKGFNLKLGMHRGITMAGTGGAASGTDGSSGASVLPVIVLGEEEAPLPKLGTPSVRASGTTGVPEATQNSVTAMPDPDFSQMGIIMGCATSKMVVEISKTENFAEVLETKEKLMSVVMGGGDGPVFVFDGLEDGTDYYLRAKVTSVDGYQDSDYSAVVKATTVEAPLPKLGAPTVRASGTTGVPEATQNSVTAMPDPDFSQMGVIMGCSTSKMVVEISKTENFAEVLETKEKLMSVVMGGGDGPVFVFDGLEDGTDYYLRAKVTSVDGYQDSDYSAVVKATTVEAPLPKLGAPTVRASGTTGVPEATQNSVTAMPDPDFSQMGIIMGCATSKMVVEISKTEDFAEVLETKEKLMSVVMGGGDGPVFVFDGLEDGTDYYLRAKVTSVDGYQDSDYSAVVKAITVEAAENARPQLKGEDTIEVSMRLNQWHEIDLSQYFVDPDSTELTYYINEGNEWTELKSSTYLYYPAGDGAQSAVFIALDESMTLDDVDDTTPILYLTANVEKVPSEVTITFSVSQGVNKYYTTEYGEVMIPHEITVPYFDLALYGLDNVYYNPRCYASYTKPGTIGGGTAGTKETAEGVVTPLHVFIWATEVYQLGFDPEDAGLGKTHEKGLEEYFGVGQGAGSAYINLWNGTNMNYYLNLEYPVGYPGTGSTCDQQALYNGDTLSVHFIEDNNATGSSFAALVLDENDTFEFGADAMEAAVNKGESITLTAYHSVSDWNRNVTTHVPSADAAVVFIDEDHLDADTSAWKELGCTDEYGKITIDTSSMTAGTYYIVVQGTVDGTNEREAAIFVLTVVCEHSWDAATCTAPKTCSKCGETEGEALGHTEEPIPAKAATCTETGLTEGKKCSVCGEVLVAQEEIAKLAHTEETIPGKDATCTETGLTEGKKCSVCGEVLVAQTEIAAMGHVWDDGEITTQPTTSSDGVKTFTCTVCGETKTETVEKLPAVVIPSAPSKPIVKPAAPKMTFSDVSKSDWYHDSVKEAYENGLIDGMSADTFDPNGKLTIAQAIKLAAALHQLEKNGKVTLKNGSDVWYSTYVAYAINNGIIDKAYGELSCAQMNAAATRSEFVAIFHGAKDFYAEKNTVADNAIPDVKMTDKNAAEIYEFYRAGILTGNDEAGTFAPNSSIKRSEVAAILIRMFDLSARQSVSLK